MKIPTYISLDRWDNRFGSKSDLYYPFYRQKEVFISDALVETRLLPRLLAFPQAKGGAIFGYADQIRLVLEIGGKGRKGEHLVVVQPEKVGWWKDNIELKWNCEVYNPQGKLLQADEDEAVAGPVREFVGCLSMLLFDLWGVASGLAKADEVQSLPEGLVQLNGQQAVVDATLLPTIGEIAQTSPFQGNFLFNMMLGVDITTLTLVQLFPVCEVICRPEGVTLKMEFAPELAKVQDELFSFNQHLKFLKR